MPRTFGRQSKMTSEDMALLVETLKEGLMLLVRQGHITEEQADERARNQAQALFAHFNLQSYKY